MDDKYEWSVTVNAPENFPATLHYGSLSGKSIRGSATLDSGWGLSGSFTSSMRDNRRELPKKLSLVWMSWLENQFYEGSFELDQKKIKAIFEKGFKEDTYKGVVISHKLSFIVNVAPGGGVAIWVVGIDGFQREVGFYQAKKTAVLWKDFNSRGEQDREKVVKVYTDEIPPEIVADYKANKLSFKKWETYRQPFTWSVYIKDKPHMVFLNAYAFNGEEYRIDDDSLKIKEDSIYSALPKKLKMQWEEPDQVKECFTATCVFKEADYTAVAAAFKENNNTGSFEIVPYLDNNIKKLRLYLITGTKKQEIHLEENRVKRAFYK